MKHQHLRLLPTDGTHTHQSSGKQGRSSSSNALLFLIFLWLFLAGGSIKPGVVSGAPRVRPSHPISPSKDPDVFKPATLRLQSWENEPGFYVTLQAC
jgi:hypothetical protein